MKTRSSFVSNSSSSSFILALKMPKCCPTCGRTDDDFISYFQHNNHSDTEFHSQCAEDIISRLDGLFYDTQDKKKKEITDRINKIITEQPDWRVLYFDLSKHDFDFINRIDDMIQSGKAEEIYRTYE